MKEIIIDVTDDGEIKIETQGFTGKSCVEETGFIKNLLGHEIAKQLTPAYYTQNKKNIRKHIPLCG